MRKQNLKGREGGEYVMWQTKLKENVRFLIITNIFLKNLKMIFVLKPTWGCKCFKQKLQLEVLLKSLFILAYFKFNTNTNIKLKNCICYYLLFIMLLLIILFHGSENKNVQL